MSEASDIAVIKTAIDGQFASPRAVEIDEAPSRTADHVVVFLSRRYTEGELMSGEARTVGSRLITRYVARTLSNVKTLRERTRTAVEEKFLPDAVGPFSFETEHEPLDYDPDDGGWFTSADSWIS